MTCLFWIAGACVLYVFLERIWKRIIKAYKRSIYR